MIISPALVHRDHVRPDPAAGAVVRGRGGDAGRAEPEGRGLLDADVVIVSAPEESRDALRSLPVFGDLPAVAEDRLTLVDPTVGYAMRFPGASKIEWFLERLVEGMEGALGEATDQGLS